MVSMKVPVSKVKFVCHNKSDTSLFGVILATDRVTSESQRLYRIFCYQADQKIVRIDFNIIIDYLHCMQ